MSKILFVIGSDLSLNNSANLCHIAYINGMLENGHNVDVITRKPMHSQDYEHISNVKYFEFSDQSWLLKIFRARTTNRNQIKNESINTISKISIKGQLLNFFSKSYFGSTKTWLRNVQKFHSDTKYDYVISLSSPPVSHLASAILRKKKKILYEKECQIWEDPWATDLYGGDNSSLLKKEEDYLSRTDKIFYVTPLTLEKQKKIFPCQAHKMNWLPLPSYYNQSVPYREEKGRFNYGYFGQYYPHVRNLEPFFRAVKTTNREAIICGDPSNLFNGNDKIKIHSRMSIEDLSKEEARTDVLVFVANKGGGQIPGKIYQYSATTKPILFILDGNEHEKKIIKKYFQQFNRYAFCDNTVESITKAMDSIESNKRTYQPVEYFTPQNITSHILKTIDEGDN